MESNGLQAFKEKSATLLATAKEQGRTLIAEEFKKFFEAYPEVGAVRWNQYTPTFSDVEPCVFSRGDFEIALDFVNSLNEDTEYETEDFISPWDDQAQDKERLQAAFKLLSQTFDGDVDMLFKHAFGDNVQVIATANEFRVDDYYDNY